MDICSHKHKHEKCPDKLLFFYYTDLAPFPDPRTNVSIFFTEHDIKGAQTKYHCSITVLVIWITFEDFQT